MHYLQMQFVVWDLKVYISIVLYISLVLRTVKFAFWNYISVVLYIF